MESTLTRFVSAPPPSAATMLPLCCGLIDCARKPKRPAPRGRTLLSRFASRCKARRCNRPEYRIDRGQLASRSRARSGLQAEESRVMFSGRVSHHVTCRPSCRERSWHDHPGSQICTHQSEQLKNTKCIVGPVNESRRLRLLDLFSFRFRCPDASWSDNIAS